MDAVYVEEMPVRELKEVITAAGLSYADCLEKSDLRARAQEAMVFLRQMSGPARVLQRERARRAHGGAAAAPASFRGAASSLSESESEAEAPRNRPPPARPPAPAEAPAGWAENRPSLRRGQQVVCPVCRTTSWIPPGFL